MENVLRAQQQLTWLRNPLWQGRPRPCGKAEAALLHRVYEVLQLHQHLAD